MSKEQKKGGKTAKVAEPEVIRETPPVSAAEKREVQALAETIIRQPQEQMLKLSRGQIALLKRTVAQGATDDELMLFLNICRGAQLNPFLHQAHFVPFWDSKADEERRAVIVGIDGFRAIAESTGAYAGNDDPIFEGEEDVEVEVWEGKGSGRKVTGKRKVVVPKKATVSVYKIVAGERYAFTATARWSEYYPGSKKGTMWHKMPYLMLGKVAEALALRKAFPKLLSGMYAQEEMDQAQQSDGARASKAAAEGVKKLIAAAKSSDLKTLKSYLKKLDASDKYSDEQKAEVHAALDPRVAELEKKPTKDEGKEGTIEA